jgi:hypothetical protein
MFQLYKIHITHELKEQDKASHVNFCWQFLDTENNYERVVDVLIMSDEAHFHLSGYVKKQKWKGNRLVWCFHIWGDRALFLWGKQPGCYRGFWALLHYAANIFGYGTVKDQAKGEKCMVPTGWCNGPHGKAKHDFS